MFVKVEGFQAIDKVEIDLPDVSVIVGETNVGKSTLFRAIKYALRNQSGTSFIRDGCSECKVILDGILDKHGNPHTIQWTKKRKGGSFYIVDGKKYDAVGRKTLDVVDDFGFGIDEIRGRKLDVLFHDQGAPPFMLYDPAEAIAVVSASGNILVLQEALNISSIRIKETKQKIKFVSAEKGSVEDSLESISFLNWKEVEKGIQDTLNSLLQKKRSIEETQKVVDEFISIQSFLKVKESLGDLFEFDLTSVIDMFSVIYESMHLNHVISLYEKCISDVVFLESIFNKLEGISKEILYLTEYVQLSKDIEFIKNSLSFVTHVQTYFSNIISVLERLSILQDFNKILDEIDKTKEKILLIEKDLVTFENDISKLFSELGVCPMCGQEIKESFKPCLLT